MKLQEVTQKLLTFDGQSMLFIVNDSDRDITGSGTYPFGFYRGSDINSLKDSVSEYKALLDDLGLAENNKLLVLVIGESPSINIVDLGEDIVVEYIGCLSSKFEFGEEIVEYKNKYSTISLNFRVESKI